MSASLFLLSLAMLILAILVVIAPLRQAHRKTSPALVTGGRAGPTHTQALLALRDLEFDHQTGKIAAADFPEMRAALVAQAAAALEAEEAAQQDRSTRVEAAISAHRRASPADGRCQSCGAALAAEDRFCSACGHPSERACPRCSTEATPGDRYCSRCGAALTPIEAKGES